MGYVTFKDPRTGKSWRTDTDLGLIRESVSIGSPKVRKYTVEVPGADGVLDCSEVHGRVTYEPRPVEISVGKAIKDRFAQDSLVKNALHGKQMQITLSDDPDYYYFGRIAVDEWRRRNGIGSTVISAECDPYKYRQESTAISATVPESGTVVLTLFNNAMPAVPTITADDVVTLGWQGSTYTVSAGTMYRNLDIELAAGENVLQVTAAPGTTVTVEYQEGSL